MKSHVASRQPGLCHEAYGIILADCFAFQTDIVAGDANMSGHRFGGSRRGSASLKHSCWQDMVRYFVKAYNNGQNQDPNCRLIPRFLSSNPLSSLRWWEDTFGVEYDRCLAVNWDTVPTLDCIVCCILEWAHSIPMEKWSGSARTGVQDHCQRVALALIERRLLVQPVGQGQPHALVGAPEPSPHQACRCPCTDAYRDEDGLKGEEKGASKTQQGARGWCYIWYYGYDEHCTTTYQGHYSIGCGTAKNDAVKTKFSGADDPTEGQRDSSTRDSAKVSACRRQGQVQGQRQGGNL